MPCKNRMDSQNVQNCLKQNNKPEPLAANAGTGESTGNRAARLKPLQRVVTNQYGGKMCLTAAAYEDQS